MSECVSVWVGFNITISTLYLTSETNLLSQSLALVLITSETNLLSQSLALVLTT